MNWSKWIRQFHRWLALAFTAGFIVNLVVVMRGVEAPAFWVYLTALIPLFCFCPPGCTCSFSLMSPDGADRGAAADCGISAAAVRREADDRNRRSKRRREGAGTGSRTLNLALQCLPANVRNRDFARKPENRPARPAAPFSRLRNAPERRGAWRVGSRR